MFPLAERPQTLRSLVLVEHSWRFFPDVQRLLAHTEQHGDVLRCDNVSLAEAGVFRHAGNNLRHVVAQHMPHGAFGFDLLHESTSQ